tara:strand:- start:692 stop:2620 length:1929 start_codon:yes stop_codon:yes gene_type:complete
VDINKVSIQNFLIIGQADINLSNRGLCRIAGENSDDVTSSSNGSGKSSIIEAIYWGLFGETLRNVRSADGVVNNKTKKNCSVVVELQEDDTVYRVERYRKHSKHKNNLYLYINDVDSRGKDNRETQEYIEGVIGMDKMAFANSVIFGQGNSKNLKRFSEMTDSEKKATLEKILNLESFGKAYDLVRDRIRDIEDSRNRVIRCLGDLRHRAEACEERLSSALQRAQQFAVERDLKVEALQSKKISLEEGILNLTSRIDALVPEDADHLKESVSACESFIAEERDRKGRLSDSFMEKRNEQLILKASIEKDIEKNRRKLEALVSPDHVGETCSVCGGHIKEENLLHFKDGVEFDIEDLGRTVTSIAQRVKSLTSRYKEIVGRIEEGIEEAREMRDEQKSRLDEVAAISNKKLELSCKLEAHEELLSSYDTRIQDIKDEVNVWEETAKEYADDLQKLSTEIEAFEEEESTFKDSEDYYQFWKTAFSRKGIRSYLLDRIVPFLNDRVGHYLNILTDGGIEAQFQTVKQLASGEYRDNFNLEITNKNAADTYEGNSGGEKRRIDLGVALGFNDFLASRSGKRFNLLLLDEVFEGVDEDGLYYVIKVLEDIARRKSSVFVITHRDELKGYFSDEVVVKRDAGLSYVSE